MNQSGQPGPPGPAQTNPGAAAGPPRGQPAPMYKPEQMRGIGFLSDAEKRKYEDGLRQLWQIYDNNPEGSAERESAKKKIQDFAPVLAKKVRDRKLQAQAQQQAQQGGQNANVPGAAAAAAAAMQAANAQTGAAAAMAAAGRPAADSGAGDASGPGAGPGPAAAAARPPGPQQTVVQQPKLSDAILKHLREVTFTAPANVPPEQAQKWQEDVKKRYANSLLQIETARAQMNKIDQGIKLRTESGQPLSPEEHKALAERRAQIQKAFENASRFVSDLRKSQENNSNNNREPQIKTEAGGAGGAAAQQARPQAAPQPSAQIKTQQQPPNASLQNSQANINGAIEAAKKEQLAAAGRMQAMAAAGGGGGGVGGGPSQQQSQPSQMAASLAQASPVTQTPVGIKVEGGVGGSQAHPPPPPVNTALAAAAKVAGLPSAGTPTQNSARVQTPQSATPHSNVPRALSHQKALEEANKQRSTSGPIMPGQTVSTSAAGTPSSGSAGVMGTAAQPQQQQQGHPHAHPNQPQQQAQPPPQPPQQTLQSKLPIPKQLPEKATLPPQPVSLGGGLAPGRPTYSGGGGIGGGVMGQPVVNKVPAIQMDSEGERVLNKKKLDELVRQVSGGTAEGQEGNMLAPEVEESILNLADSFVDNVLHTACRNAKERGSKVLEIRDLQLVLERTYNIRIPGYSSDELRTVRKIQPSMQWISKMSIVQAAKVMPGKGDL